MTATETTQSKRGCAFNIIDAFTLLTGSLGLIVDSIALITLLFSVINTDNGQTTIDQQALPNTSVMIILFLILLYSWLAISWYLIRRSYKHLSQVNPTKLKKQIIQVWRKNSDSIVGSVAVITLPLWWIWIFFAGLTTSPKVADNLLLYLLVILVASTLVLSFLGAIISLIITGVITTLMPVVYPDMYYSFDPDEEDWEI